MTQFNLFSVPINGKVEVEKELLEEMGATYSADTIMAYGGKKSQLRGIVPWLGHDWVCTGTMSTGKSGTQWVDLDEVVPLSQKRDIVPTTYSQLKSGHGYRGCAVFYKGQPYVMTGRRLEACLIPSVTPDIL